MHYVNKGTCGLWSGDLPYLKITICCSLIFFLFLFTRCFFFFLPLFIKSSASVIFFVLFLICISSYGILFPVSTWGLYNVYPTLSKRPWRLNDVGKTFYFIPRSEFNVYPKQIKVILSAVKRYRIFSLVTNTLYIFALQQTEAVSTILGLISFRNDLKCNVLVWHYAAVVRTSNKLTDFIFWRHFCAHITLICTRRQSDGSFKRLS